MDTNEEADMINEQNGTEEVYYNPKDLLPITLNDGKVFDFAMINGHPMITDYSRIDREILSNGENLTLGKKKNKIRINSIKELYEIISAFIELICKNERTIKNRALYKWGYNNLHMSDVLLPPFSTMNSSNNEGSSEIPHYDNFESVVPLIANQIIFDVLYDKYLKLSPSLTLNEYCTKHIDFDWNGHIYKELKAEELGVTYAIYQECYKLALENYHNTSLKLLALTRL